MKIRNALLLGCLAAIVWLPCIAADEMVDFQPYLTALQDRLRARWNVAPDFVATRVVVEFAVLRDGSVQDVHVVVPSKDKDKNEAAMAAVTGGAPFQPLPDGSPDRISIRFTFSQHMSAKLLNRLEKKELAKRTTKSSAHKSDNEYALLNNQAVAAMNRGEMNEAIRLFERVLEMKPDYTYAKANMAIAYNNRALKSPAAKALPDFFRAVSLQPTNETTMHNLRQVLKTGLVSAQVQKIVDEQTARTNADSPAEQHVAMGIAWEMNHEWSKAEAEYKRALELDKSSPAEHLLRTLDQRRNGD